MLSLEKGRPIAKFLDEDGECKILYLDTTEVDNNFNKKKGENICPKCDKSFSRSDALVRHQKKSCVSLHFDKYLNNYLEKNNINIKNNSSKEFILLNNECLIPLPNIDNREILYIGGPQNSGKSCYAAMYVYEFKKIFPDKDIFLFSFVNEDDALDKMKKIKRIVVNEELLEDPIDIKTELANSCVIFDDIESSTDSKLSKYMEMLRDDIIKNGRDQAKKGRDIYCISTSHMLCDFKKTRNILNECTSITIFPKSGSTYHIKDCLKRYCGLSKKDIEKIMDLPSRWVTIYKHYPMYVIYEKGAYVIK